MSKVTCDLHGTGYLNTQECLLKLLSEAQSDICSTFLTHLMLWV